VSEEERIEARRRIKERLKIRVSQTPRICAVELKGRVREI